MKEKPDQMPGLLAKIDDPWGISWRVVNQIRRLSVRRSLRFARGYALGVRHERPVFIIGAARSGTTMLFQLLRESEELGSLPGEGHDAWRMYHHPRRRGWSSDAVRAEEIGWGERRFLDAYFYSHFDESRFVEKTPENSLRVAYLQALYPDATFVVIRRNPCDVISSLINGWRHPAGRYRSYFVPVDLDIPGYTHRRQWCFSLFEGWRDYTASPVPRIALAQWSHYTRAIASARRTVPRSRWIELHLERIIENPIDSLSRICEAIQVQETSGLRSKLAELSADPVNALSESRQAKWRVENELEIRELLPAIARLAPEAGYRLDPLTGECEIAAD